SGGDVFDLIGDVDPTDEDGDIGMGDSTCVSASLDGEMFLEGKKHQESNIGDSDNTRYGGKIVAGIEGKKCRESNIGDSDNTRNGGKIVPGIGDSLA
nr:hypothetical protein [Tanacetum cinerariifolium]